MAKRTLESHDTRDLYKNIHTYSNLKYKHSGKPVSLNSPVRGERFINFIKNILINRGLMKPEQVDALMTSKNIELFNRAFTHTSYNLRVNYELLEFAGDKVVDYALAQYLINKYPKLMEPGKQTFDGLKIISKAQLHIRSFAVLSYAAQRLGFDEYIGYNREEYPTPESRSKIHEDVFEAFIGACDVAINSICESPVGYIICYEIVKSIFEEINISLEHHSLVDPVTRFKELMEKYGNVKSYQYFEKSDTRTVVVYYEITYITHQGKTVTIATPKGIDRNDKLAYDHANKSLVDKLTEITSGGYNSIVSVIPKKEMTELRHPRDNAITSTLIYHPSPQFIQILGNNQIKVSAEGTDQADARKKTAFQMLDILFRYKDANGRPLFTENTWDVREFSS